MLDENGVGREGSDLFWIELIAYGKHKLDAFVFRGRCNNRAIDVGQTVQHCSHRRIDERLSSQPLPWEIDIHADGALCIGPCDRDRWRKHFEETLYTFSVPGQGYRSSFVRPVIEIRRGAARVIAV